MRFSNSLDRALETIERPPNLPVGHYTWQITKHPEIATRGDYEILTFQCTPVEPHDDVDEQDLADYGDFTKTVVRKQFLTPIDDSEKAAQERALYDVSRFLEHAAVDETLELSQAMAESVNAQFVGELRHRPDKNDPEVIYQEIGTTAPV